MKIYSTLYFKYIVVTLAIMFFSGVLALLATNAYYHRVIKEQNDAKNVAIVQKMTQYIMENEQLNLDAYLQTLANVGYQLYVVDGQGQDTFYGSAFRLTELDDSVKHAVLEGQIYHGMRDYPRQLFITGFFANDLTNSVGVPFHYDEEKYALFVRPDIRMLFSEMHVVLGNMMLISLVATLMAILLAAWYLVKPIRALTKATKQIAKEDYDVTIEIARTDELGLLAKSFNKMAQDLKQQDETRKSFIRNISHDLQTPLQNINGYANLLKSKELTDENRLHYADIIEAETGRLSSLTKQLLLLNSLDELAYKRQQTAINISEQIERIVMKNQWLIEQKELAIWLQLDAAIFDGDETLLENLWENLIANAIKYNRQGGEINITVQSDSAVITIEIADTGIGIEQEHLPHIFKRFYRVDEARQTKGTGLGLAIVQEIIHFYNGQITMNSKENAGTTIIIKLPK
ncbi:HAMP domain-containing sensor histidine kinase [Metasolibacillus sp.]|uniref:sensor histidine kinase n=1 Tax=Metasolibacillus sp. TaxID=2703680 RepID=UPI0025EB0FAA|nr:HAMP domain-containing sensor histidine kinase [Metasolibacillus sp.]MCT6925026.1 HAMP domain-containing histidine kinase [Metasolibacillus sp.]MCT6941281.1 HAMP domain-containing histidine kinase [Metasolibacillus sp.]